MSKEMIDAITDGDNLSAENEFKNLISTKIGDALEVKRAELARSISSERVSSRLRSIRVASPSPGTIL